MINSNAGHAYQALTGTLSASDADDAEVKVHAVARGFFGEREFRVERMDVRPHMVSDSGEVLAYEVDYEVRERGDGWWE